MATAKTPAKRAAKATPATQPPIPEIGQHLPELGGTYIGIASDIKGGATGHLVLLDARPAACRPWGDAMGWAKALGNDARLPTRAEALLVFANTTNRPTSGWHWTCEEDDASSAWDCYFYFGGQDADHMSAAGAAVAVRRLPLQYFNPLDSVAAV